MSFHFQLEGHSYINFEHVNQYWVEEDKKVIKRQNFEHEKYDEEERHFEASVIWGDNSYNNEDYAWHFNVTFSSDFNYIESGNVIYVD